MNIKPEFYEDLKVLLPDTYVILVSSSLEIHERVTCVMLHGSRGPKDNPRPDSDLDLSLITDISGISESDLGKVLDEVTRTEL
jgi:predicted nucleotidyltransferase